MPAEALTLEITEDVLMADAARSQQVMAGLRRLGVRLSIDDYGTGYSSLSYLRALPVDELKLDRSFVSHLTSDERAAAIVRSTLQLSLDLGMSMVVEGVEDAATLRRAAGLGLRRRAGLPHRPADAGRRRSSAGWPPAAGAGAASGGPRRPCRAERHGNDRAVHASRLPDVDLERLAARSWRGLEEEPFGDWLLRAGGGFTGRANSVLVVGDPPAALPDGRRRRRPAGTRERGLRPRPRCRCPAPRTPTPPSPPPGWTRDEDVLVLTAPPRRLGRPRRCRSTSRRRPDDAWLAGYRYRGTPLPPVAARGAASTPTSRSSPSVRLRPGAGPAGRRRPRRRRRRLAGASPP